MKNFNKSFSHEKGNDSGKRDFKKGGQGKRKFGDRDRERSQMHEAICADCGKKCEVPFKPTGDKPVYCNQCFSNRKERSISNRPERRDYERPRFQDKKMFDATCDKCGKRFELPFRPTGDKPVYCNQCFDRGGSFPNKSNDKAVNQYKEQFDILNAKLDRIIRALAPAAPVKEKKKEVIIKKKKAVVEKKKVVIKKKEKTKKPKKPADKKPKKGKKK